MIKPLLADAILVVHFGFVLFIVLGLALIWIGVACGWQWVRSMPFRLAHLAAIVLVALESLAGIACPLTVWEAVLRDASASSFVGHWVGRLLYYDFPDAVFTAAYVVFAALVIVTFVKAPPRRKRTNPG